jgi:voltage-gated potassium channel
MPGRQQRRGSEAYDRYVQFSQAPMTALAFLMIPVLLVPLIRPLHGAVAISFDAADYLIWALFAADYGVRFKLAPDRPRFVRTHVFDLAVVVLPFLRPLRVLRALRGLGELRALRVLQASRLAAFLGTGFGHARDIIRRRGLHYVVGVVVAIMLAAAGLEVAFEAHAKGGTIHNYGDALWWSVVTVTSVGYGDESPVTTAGRVVAVVLMITGIALFGVVAASIASYFVEQDSDRRVDARMDEILTVLHRLEARLDAAEGRPAPAPAAGTGPVPVPASEPVPAPPGAQLAAADALRMAAPSPETDPVRTPASPSALISENRGG